MNPWQRDVTEFHRVSEQAAPDRVDFSKWPGDLRLALIEEEARETREAWEELQRLQACDAPDFNTERREAEIVDGLIDLIYVTIGAAVSAGIDLEKFWNEVHAANMRKFPGGKVLRRSDGKILKPEGWKPPDIERVLDEAKRQPVETSTCGYCCRYEPYCVCGDGR